MAENENKEFLMFKGHPLVRFGNIIFYGSVTDKYIIMMQVIDEEDYSKELPVKERSSSKNSFAPGSGSIVSITS